jgi:hypothetical protein
MQRLKLPLWCWLIPVLLLAFWLGARGLDADPIWGDEVSSIHDAGGSLYGPLSPVGIWNRVAGRNPWHAPGYFITLNAWGRVVGWDPGALRALSLLLGVLAVAWTYRLGRDFVSARVGLYGAALLATSVLYVHYLDKVRMYTLIALVTLMTLWVYLRIVRAAREPTRIWWLALLASASASLYAHYLAVMPLVAIGLYHLIFAPKNRRWWKVVGVFALAGVLFLPWVRVLVAGVGRASENEELHSLALNGVEVVARALTFFGNGVIFLPLIAFGLALTVRRIRRLGFFALAIMLLILVTNELVHIIDERRMRYLIAAWPLLALVAGAGVARLERWKPLPVIILALWAGLGVWHSLNATVTPMLDGYRYIFPLQRVAYYVRDDVQPGDVVVNYVPDAGLDSDQYENIASFYYTPLGLDYLMAQGDAEPILAIAETHPRIFLAYAPDQRPASLDLFVEGLLQTRVNCAVELSSVALAIELYTLPGLCGSD